MSGAFAVVVSFVNTLRLRANVVYMLSSRSWLCVVMGLGLPHLRAVFSELL